MNPWQRVHADFAGCGGTRYLVIVDAQSKWIETLAMERTDATTTIKLLRRFCTNPACLPSHLDTDN